MLDLPWSYTQQHRYHNYDSNCHRRWKKNCGEHSEPHTEESEPEGHKKAVLWVCLPVVAMHVTSNKRMQAHAGTCTCPTMLYILLVSCHGWYIARLLAVYKCSKDPQLLCTWNHKVTCSQPIKRQLLALLKNNSVFVEIIIVYQTIYVVFLGKQHSLSVLNHSRASW